jgi:hypothetical protein
MMRTVVVAVAPSLVGCSLSLRASVSMAKSLEPMAASLVAFLRPGDGQGRGPYGLEVWRLMYRAR